MAPTQASNLGRRSGWAHAGEGSARNFAFHGKHVALAIRRDGSMEERGHAGDRQILLPIDRAVGIRGRGSASGG